VHHLLLRQDFRRKLINVVFCLLSLHFKLLESVKLICLRHREYLRLALSLRLHLGLSVCLLEGWLVDWLLDWLAELRLLAELGLLAELRLLALLELTRVCLLRLADGCWVVRDLHLFLALLIVRIFLNFLSSQPEQVLELLDVVVILLGLVSKFFAHIDSIAIP